MRRFYIVTSCVIAMLNIACGVFNFEIGARVTDKLSDFTYFISQTLKVSAREVNSDLTNISNPIFSCRNMFFATILTYKKEIANFFVGLEDGTHFAYITLEGVPLGVTYAQSPFKGSNGDLFARLYTIGEDGLPRTYIQNTSYNVRERPWYITAKMNKINYWTAPYIDAGSGFPVISLIYPILNYTLKGQYMTYAGSIGADVYLQQISAYLVNAYHNTNMNVFVVDRGTLSLLGNSWGAMTYASGPGDSKVRKSSSCLE